MKKKIIKWTIIVVVSGLVIGGGIVLYMWNMPQRNVQETPVDFKLNSEQLVKEYLSDAKASNAKYLQTEGDSKILAVTGEVFSITEDLKHQKVVLLKKKDEKVGVSCTFMQNTNENANKLKIGDKVTIKGVIRAGAGYDEDLELYEDAIMEKCDVYLSENEE